jgi:hypothetical protein
MRSVDIIEIVINIYTTFSMVTMPNVTMLTTVMLSVNMFNVSILNVVVLAVIMMDVQMLNATPTFSNVEISQIITMVFYFTIPQSLLW